jgi:hypothetical protein
VRRSLLPSLSCRLRGSAAGVGFKHCNTPIELPQLDVVGINELRSALPCFLLVGTLQIGHAYNVAVVIQKVSSVVRHFHPPGPHPSSVRLGVLGLFPVQIDRQTWLA